MAKDETPRPKTCDYDEPRTENEADADFAAEETNPKGAAA